MKTSVLILTVLLLIGCDFSEKKSESDSASEKSQETDQRTRKYLCGKWFLESTNATYYEGALNTTPFISDRLKEMDLTFSKEGIVYIDSLKVGKWYLKGKKLALSKISSEEINFDLNFEYLITRLDKTGLELKSYYFDRNKQIKLELEYIFSRKPNFISNDNNIELEL